MGSSLIKFTSILLALLLAWASCNYFNFAQTLRKGQLKSAPTDILINSKRAQQQRQIDVELSQTLAQLEYMVWPKERAALSERLLYLAKENIQRQPFSAYGWHVLVNAMDVNQVVAEERLWALRHAIDFNEWRFQRRVNLVAQCVSPTLINHVLASQALVEQCGQLIAESQSRALRSQLSKVLHLSASQIDAQLQKFSPFLNINPG